MTVKTGLTRADVKAYVDKFESTRVLVTGDIMLDRYFWGEVDRISPEAPVPIVRVTRRSARLGGAANVAANLSSLGVQVSLAGTLGVDGAAREVGELLSAAGVNREWLRDDPEMHTTEKVRIIARSQQLVRADFESENPAGVRGRALLEELGATCDRYDALVVSDYGKGVVSEAPVRALITAWRAAGRPVLIDPHIRHFHWYRGATIITPNTKQAASFFDATVTRDDLFHRLAFQIRETLALDALLITRGEEGMSLFLADGEQINIPAVATEVYDVTGAGDTVISVLAAGLASGVPLIEAVVLANQAAGEVVKEVGTSTVAADRLVNSFPA